MATRFTRALSAWRGAECRRALRLLAVVAVGLVASCGDGDSEPGQGGASVDAAVAGGDAAAAEPVCSRCDDSCVTPVAVEGAAHVDGPIDYPELPPAGGSHDSCWLDYGVYSSPPAPPERWVHNLEHGAVVYLYNCPGGCDADVTALEQLVEGLPRIILTPYADMPPGFAAVAWGQRLVSSCLDLDALMAFFLAHYDNAPESVNSGAPDGC